MGGKNDKIKNYEIPLNKELNRNITHSINVIKKKDLEKFNRLLHKNVKSDIKNSNFKATIKGDDNGYNNILSLMNLIYTKSTNNFLKNKGNRTIYEAIFNYDIVEKKGEGYEKFKQNIAQAMRCFIAGEKNNNLNGEVFFNQNIISNNSINDNNSINNNINDNNSINNNTNDNTSINNTNDNTSINNNNNNSINNNNYNSINNNNNNNNNNSGIFKTLNLSIKEENNSIVSEKKEILKPHNPVIHDNLLNNQNSFKNSFHSNNNSNNPNIHYSGILTDPSFKNLNNKEKENNILKKKTPTLIQNIEELNNTNSKIKTITMSKDDRNERSLSKKKHKKNPNKEPIINIKVDLRQFYKEDVMQKEIENEINKGRIPQNSFLKAKQNNFYNDNENEESFINKIDRYTQPNKLENEIIHNEMKEKNSSKMFKGNTSNKNITYKMNATKKKY